MLKVVEKTKIWIAISLTIIIIGLGFIAFKGLNFGIDFKGGSVITVDIGKKVTTQDLDTVRDVIGKYVKSDSYSLRTTNQKEIEMTIKSGAIEEEKVGALKDDVIKSFKSAKLLSEETIGSVIGKELTKKAWIAVIIASIAMLIYIAMRFEFTFGLAAIIALVHDILITLSVYAIFGLKLNSPFIAAMLTILGYSINDTIVVFDRIRENMKKSHKLSLDELTNMSVNQTLARSINTSLSTLFTIVAVLIFVPSIRELAIPLIVGIISGSYSSIFIASPIWVLLKKRKSIAKA
ncbi:protein-export membrane protein SecF [Clostridium tepidiprofundi DSM 19306]|uniref:Protein-export membrane protein SecF n=1 Tax=Clostridium tepidiprofundi DSM 19306 TaxID=1121338 RepID=A0A151B884_9CLOT|nr:protein translocase subunit SecF [Clostridium tepidiprofundi]KYH36023.1 protein-export membrane protein SecF [Clostridium tepidiprofundi DSM 19306]